MRIGRASLAVLAAAFVAWPTTAAAQVDLPPLPVVPVPEQAGPVLTVLAPVASPACGNAALLAIAGPGLAAGLPVDLAPVLGYAVGPVFVACASVPLPPEATQLQCALDDQTYALASAATIAAIGAEAPVGTRAVGPVVEIVAIVESQAPDAVADQGAAGQLGFALACRQLRPSAAPSPATDAVDDDVRDELAAGVPGLGGADLALGGFDRLAGGTDAVFGEEVDPGFVQPAAAVASARPFDYPFVFVLPLVLLAVGGYLAQALTEEVRLPRRG